MSQTIEDATYRPDEPILARGLATERIHAAVETARAMPYPFTLTARSENFIRGCPDLEDTLSRLQAFEAAGADVLYPPGLPDESALRLACASVTKPFNYVAGCGPTALPSPSSRSSGCAGSRSVPRFSALALPPSLALLVKCSTKARSTTSTAYTPSPISTNSSIPYSRSLTPHANGVESSSARSTPLPRWNTPGMNTAGYR